MWSLVVLTGFSYEEMYGRFAGTKKSDRINEVVVRWGSTVSHFVLSFCHFFLIAIIEIHYMLQRILILEKND